MIDATRSRAAAAGGKDARALLASEVSKLHVRFRGKGHKSSEGDGVTAADLERQLAIKAKE